MTRNQGALGMMRYQGALGMTRANEERWA